MIETITFFANSFLATALLAIAIAIIGSIMLINRYNYLAASIAHGSYGGVGMAIYLGTGVVLGATLFAVALALLLAYITYKENRRTDILIGVLWAVGMSIGIIFIDLTPGYNVDLLAFLFGNILLIPKSDLFFMAGVDLALLIYLSTFYHHILAVAYDKEFALTRGLNVKLIHTLTLILIALTVVMSIRSIGLILVIALFSIPPYIAEKYTKNFISMMIVAGIISFIIMCIGLFVASSLNISATASIIIIAGVLFILTFIRIKQ
ncbi:zinc transport system permease protein [Nitratiruptor tergarcus DSM 16512]|uniref:Zinc transport system permease protein n=2 Tax=Nitratiruptor tergarcus TaxID=269259 RepID=A0A1W1WRS1_9BACT|nr:iron chelate uptake ABC transporter family permease subunit [Nitratiruptor tergarcus]SMC09011.1 zinc transport system permease protein [Nitratiruptor tergarcus DSM 16512]